MGVQAKRLFAAVASAMHVHADRVVSRHSRQSGFEVLPEPSGVGRLVDHTVCQITPSVTGHERKMMENRERVNECSGSRCCSADVELRSTLADLRTAEAAVRDEPYERLPALAGSLAIAAHRMELIHERGERLEKALSYAMTAERTNTDDWMRGLADAINRVLVADGDHQRCVYNGDRLLLRSIRQVMSP